MAWHGIQLVIQCTHMHFGPFINITETIAEKKSKKKLYGLTK